ncbi:MAG TPA: hypothetical protein VGM68_12580 [Rhizomicrobium sp.]
MAAGSPAGKRDLRFRTAQQWGVRKQIAIAEIAAAANALIRDDMHRGRSDSTRTHEMALRDAVTVLRAVAKLQAAAKPQETLPRAGEDLLDGLIRDIVTRRPGIGLTELRLYLRACSYCEGVVSVSPLAVRFSAPNARRTKDKVVEISLLDLRQRFFRICKDVAKRKQRQPAQNRPAGALSRRHPVESKISP